MIVHRLALATSVGLIAIAVPLTAQVPPELAALDAQLPGDLMNDPTRIDWQSYGTNYKTDGRAGADIPGGGAARIFDIQAQGANIYDVAANVPLLSAINAGEQMTVGFYARALSTDRADGKGTINVRFQQNSAPYPGFGDTQVLVGKDWDWYEVSARADRRITKADAIVALQLAGARQVLEIGQLIVVKNAATIVTAPPPQPQPTMADPASIEMPDPLRSAGQLINNPVSRNWTSGGSGGRSEGIDVPDIWLGKATRFTTPKAGENRWDLSTAIPISMAVREGDQLLVAVIARTLSAQSDDGKGLIYARVQSNNPPYDGFGDKAFKIGDRWQMVRVPFTITQSFAAGTASVALHFAGQPQSVEVGPVYIFKTN